MNLDERITEAEARQAEWEDQLAALLDPIIHRFLAGVLSDARRALDSPTLLAAGRTPDPFAFTNVQRRWTLAVNLILETPRSQLAHSALLDEVVERVLREADLPHTAAAKAVAVLSQYRDEEWTKAKAKRMLRSEILPPAPAAGKDSDEWSWYKARVRTIARSAATRASSLRTMEDRSGFSHKRWIVPRFDGRVRDPHIAAHGQTVPYDDLFIVGGYGMQYPGDPAAPLSLTANCRCLLVLLDPRSKEGSDVSPELTAAAGATNTSVRWRGPIAFEGVITGDDRMVSPGGWTWDEPPFTLRHAPADYGEHKGAVAIGRVDLIERRADGMIWAEGIIDLGSEAGIEAARLIAEKITNGISVDPDSVSFEYRVRPDLLEDDSISEDPEGAGLGQLDAEGRITVGSYTAGDELMVYTSARIRGITLLDIPAFSRARIELIADEESVTSEPPVRDEAESVAASSAPSCPPAEWFTDPKFSSVTPLTVTEDGRVFGHAAAWETCHTGFPGECVPPPRSTHSYSYFHTGALFAMTADGPRELAVGRLTVAAGHAEDGPAAPAMAHYDNTATAVADVRAGEDAFGIWVAGALRPWATEEQIRTLRASPPSGDWRRIGGNLEMVAVLCVNTAGYPIPRTSGVVASGQLMSLKAAGIVRTDLGEDEEREFVRQLMAERRAETAGVLATRRHRSAAQLRITQMARARRTNGKGTR